MKRNYILACPLFDLPDPAMRGATGRPLSPGTREGLT
jgi:hypothetical protein